MEILEIILPVEKSSAARPVIPVRQDIVWLVLRRLREESISLFPQALPERMEIRFRIYRMR